MICRSCGTPNPDNAATCSKCGATLPGVSPGESGSAAAGWGIVPRTVPLAIVGLMLGLLGVILALAEVNENLAWSAEPPYLAYLAWSIGFLLACLGAIFSLPRKR